MYPHPAQAVRSTTHNLREIARSGAISPQNQRIARIETATEVPRMRALRDRLWNGLRDMAELRVNGNMEHRIANNLYLSVTLDDCDTLVTSLTDIAVSSASACWSGSAMPSHVLQAIGAQGASTIRLTVGRFNTAAEIDYTITHLRQKLEECRARHNPAMA